MPQSNYGWRAVLLNGPRILFSKDSNGDTPRPRGHGAKRKILIVDDEHDLTSIYKTALQIIGCEVVTYNSPNEALEQFRPNQFDLAIFDVRMPDMSGFELYSKIRKLDSKLKALFVTAYDDFEQEFIVSLPDMDIRNVVKKPLRVSQLQDIVKTALRDN